MNYFIEDFSKGKVDLKASQRITEDYRKKCLKLDNMYIKDNNNTVTRPSLKPADLELPFTPTDIANIEGINYYLVIEVEEDTQAQSQIIGNNGNEVLANSSTRVGQNTIVKIYNQNNLTTPLKEITLRHLIEGNRQFFLVIDDNVIYLAHEIGDLNLAKAGVIRGIYNDPNPPTQIYKYNNIGLIDLFGVRYKIENGRVQTLQNTDTSIEATNFNKDFIDKFTYSNYEKPNINDLPLKVRQGVHTGSGSVFVMRDFNAVPTYQSILDKVKQYIEFCPTILSQDDGEFKVVPDIKITEFDSAIGAGGRYLFTEDDINVFAVDFNQISNNPSKLEVSSIENDASYPEGIGFGKSSIGVGIVLQRNNVVGDKGIEYYPVLTNIRPTHETRENTVVFQGRRGQSYYLYSADNNPNNAVGINSYSGNTTTTTVNAFQIFLDYEKVGRTLLEDLKIINFISPEGKSGLINIPMIQTNRERGVISKYQASLAKVTDAKIDYQVPTVVQKLDGSAPPALPIGGRFISATEYNANRLNNYTTNAARESVGISFDLDVSEFAATYIGPTRKTANRKEANLGNFGKTAYINDYKSNTPNRPEYYFSTRFRAYNFISGQPLRQVGQRLLQSEEGNLFLSATNTLNMTNAVKDYYNSTNHTSQDLQYLERSGLRLSDTTSLSPIDPKEFKINSKFNNFVNVTGVSAIGVRGGRPLYTLATNEKIYTLLDVNGNVIFQEAEEDVGYDTNHINESSITIGGKGNKIIALRYFQEFGGYVREIVNKELDNIENIVRVFNLSSLQDIVVFQVQDSQKLYCLSLGANRTIKGLSQFTLPIQIDRIEQLNETTLLIFDTTGTAYTMDFNEDFNSRGADQIKDGDQTSTVKFTQAIETLPLLVVGERSTSTVKTISVTKAIIGCYGKPNMRMIVDSDGSKTTTNINKIGPGNVVDPVGNFQGQLLVESITANGGKYVTVEFQKDDGAPIEISSVQLMIGGL